MKGINRLLVSDIPTLEACHAASHAILGCGCHSFVTEAPRLRHKAEAGFSGALALTPSPCPEVPKRREFGPVAWGLKSSRSPLQIV